MYTDDLLTFMDSQAFTDTAISESIVDLTLASHDMGAGEELRFYVSVDVVGADFTTFVVTLETDDAVGIDSSTTVYTSAAIGVADVLAGAKLIDIPLPSAAWLRYCACRVTFSDAGTCSLSAGLVINTDSTIKTYADGITIA